MAGIDQTLLTQQQQEKELRESRLAAQNDEAREDEAAVSIAQVTEARETRERPAAREPEEMEATLRAEQIEAQNEGAKQGGLSEKALGVAEKFVPPQYRLALKAAKKLNGARTGFRTVNFTSAASIIGLFITFIVMNAQLIGGNIFGAKWVPKLEVWEIVIIGTIDLILWLVIMMTIGLIGVIINPVDAITK